MTKKDFENGELRIGDFVKITAGSVESRKLIYVVVGIRDVYSRRVVDLRQVDGTWNEIKNNVTILHEVGYERFCDIRKVKKVNVVVKEALA